MPTNTPTIYLIAALIALGGVLIGAGLQALSSALQRRHERRMRLDDVKREAYAKFLVLVPDVLEAQREMQRVDQAVDQAAAAPGEQTSARVEELQRQMAALREQFNDVFGRLIESTATLALTAPVDVQTKADAVISALRKRPDQEPDMDTLIEAFRRDLGV